MVNKLLNGCIPVLFLLASGFAIQGGFKTEQKKNSRVKTAYSEKYEALKKEVIAQSLDISKIHIAFRVLKKEKKFEVWARNKDQKKYALFRSYDICSSSGGPGPKRQGGDGQVPEGFYHVDRFNPYSNFYLSLGVSYPNASDRILGTKGNLGGDIFIHGSCVTIGCMPLTDEMIKEVYVLAVEATSSGQNKIPVMIFPCKMDKEGMKYLAESLASVSEAQATLIFWKNIMEGYELFEENKEVPAFTIDKEGAYKFIK